MSNRPLLKKLEEMRRQDLELEHSRDVQSRRDRRWLKAGVFLAGFSALSGSISANAVASTGYVAGFTLASFGIVGISQYVENPEQSPVKDGLAELGFVGMLNAVPTITDVVLGTSGNASFQDFGSISSLHGDV